jgi:hypothetical protein
MFQFKGRWIFHIDFRYNKPEAQNRYESAKEFYETAKFCYDKQYWRPFVDILFSSTELFVASQLFVLSLIEKRTSHKSIQITYNNNNLLMNIGNQEEEQEIQHKKVFNKLSGLRNAGRYFNQPFIINQQQAEEMLRVVKEIYDFTERVIT